MIGAALSASSIGAPFILRHYQNCDVCLDFVSNTYFANGELSPASDILNCSRASAGNSLTQDLDLVSFDNHALRITDRGLLIEEPRSNYLLNSLNPITQTVSLDAGSYSVSMLGNGSLNVTGGATGIVSAGLPFAFTLASANDINVSPVGQVDAFQLEAGDFASSMIATNTSPTYRALDVISFNDVSWFDPNNFKVSIEWEQTSPGTGVQTLLRWHGNYYQRIRSGSSVLAQFHNNLGNIVYNSGVGAPPATNMIHNFSTASSSDTLTVGWSDSLQSPGGEVSTTSGPIDPSLTHIFLGSNSSSEAMNGLLRSIKFEKAV